VYADVPSSVGANGPAVDTEQDSPIGERSDGRQTDRSLHGLCSGPGAPWEDGQQFVPGTIPDAASDTHTIGREGFVSVDGAMLFVDVVAPDNQHSLHRRKHMLELGYAGALEKSCSCYGEAAGTSR
jgi:hypothetical protein